ncbi:hypothetical protein [Ruminiclostridium papyrosolvens]|uniref:Uncharacterized protein n=1 Tax=Ruminiclostridium papyrosolvens C7 TaxID=1330534 RepID=U4R1J3_9FIRM|nr:hypothetical protein [Ruminiclostridium papyrosolvens]EPR12046.1 hypothetical protein L323_09845 [Ruminiclostridium papyrosolvens C7]
MTNENTEGKDNLQLDLIEHTNNTNEVKADEVRNIMHSEVVTLTKKVPEGSKVKTSGQIPLNKKHQNSKVKNYKNKNININNLQVSSGSLLEYRIKRLLFAMGYYSKVGILIKTTQDDLADTITDLDVFGTYIHKDFTSRTIWADCKSGQARPLERISWIKGVMNTINVDSVIFVKGGVRNSTKQYARKSGIQVLDLQSIEKLESDYAIKPNDWRGSWNPNTQGNKLILFQKLNAPSNEPFRKIADFIGCDYWTYDNYTRIKKTLTAIRQLAQVTDISFTKEQTTNLKWAIYELVSLFVHALLNICKELYYFPDEEKKSTVYDGLISSEISAKKREEIIEAVFKTAYSIVQKQIPDFKPPEQNPKFNLNPPSYFEAFYDLVLRITNNPLGYYDILRFFDFVLMEYDLQEKKIIDSELLKIFNNCDDIITGTKTILHFLCQITGINRGYFQIISQ